MRYLVEHLDFTGAPILKRAYPGTSGSKLSVMYNGRQYMLKFPARAACFSEYLRCHVFDSIEIPVQQTILGTYNTAHGEKVVVACKDITEPGVVLQDFASLKNQMIDFERNGYGTELSGILDTIHTIIY